MVAHGTIRTSHTGGADRSGRVLIGLSPARPLADNAAMARFSATLGRLLVIVSLTLAFLFMASIFVPSQSQAGHAEIANDPGPSLPSVDAHDGLTSLGELKGVRHTVKIFATPEGPRYTVLDTDGVELGTLMSMRQVIRHFGDDLPLGKFRAEAPVQLIQAEPVRSDW